MITSILFTKPVKPIPKYLILKLTSDYDLRNVYKMFDTTTQKQVGVIETVVHSRKIPTKKSGIESSLFIEYLMTNIKFQGIGTKLINFAKLESEKMGCGGRIDLVASKCFTPYMPPHIFYKKLGFKCTNKLMDKYLDFCLKFKKKVPSIIAQDFNMYI